MDSARRLLLADGIQYDDLQQCAVTGRTDEQRPIATLPYRPESMLDGVPDIGVYDAVLSRAVRDLHYGTLCCETQSGNIRCQPPRLSRAHQLHRAGQRR